MWGDINAGQRGELDASAACRRLQQRGVSENCGVLQPQRGPLELYSTHEDPAGSIPDGGSYGKSHFILTPSERNGSVGVTRPRNGGAALSQGQLYVIGGSNGHSDELSCGERYDPLADEWVQVPELRTNRCNAGQWLRSITHHCLENSAVTDVGLFYSGVCSLNNKLYVVGGSDPCGQKGLKNCDVFDPVTKTWSNCASLNISTRRHFRT